MKQNGVLIIFMLFSPLLGNSEWKYLKKRDGVTVYQRAVTHSPYNEFRGSGLVCADSDSIHAVITDSRFFSQWMPRCIYSREIAAPGRGTVFTYYIESHSPWPMQNRDMVVSVRIIRTDARIVYTAKAVNRLDLAPLKKNTVRVTDMDSQWTVNIEKGRCLVSYSLRTNPGGDIPVSLMNSVGGDLPIDNIAGLRKRLKKIR